MVEQRSDMDAPGPAETNVASTYTPLSIPEIDAGRKGYVSIASYSSLILRD